MHIDLAPSMVQCIITNRKRLASGFCC